MNKKNLQIATAILAAVPVLTGLIGMLGIYDPLYASLNLPKDPLLDSNMRFFAGVWLGLGLSVYWLIPNIEKQTALFRIAWGMIFIGGLGRLISMASVGAPPMPFIVFTLLEVMGAPLFVLWQSRISR